jgi:hypothetical protein
MTLLFEYNYMKLYEKEYVLLGWQKDFGREFNVSLTGEWAKNRPLVNHSAFHVFDSRKREYTPNAPVHGALGQVSFPVYRSSVVRTRFTTKPWLKYRIRNSSKRVIPNSSPTFTFEYGIGLQEVFKGETAFHQLEAGVQHTIGFAGGGILNFNVSGGTFLDKDNLYFPHFKHFDGNRTPFTTLDPAKSFRMLDYYLYSTDEAYLTAFANYQFRKLLATQIFEVRLAGLRESVFLNVLETTESNHYTELGYGLNYIFRIFRLELVTAWEDFRYRDFAVRIGIAANLDNLFN